MFVKKSLLMCIALISQASYAQAPENVRNVIDSFVNCDSGFFHQLKNNTDEFSHYVTLNEKPDIAYIPIENPLNDDATMFDSPIEYRGLSVIGYQNLAINTLTSGQYYYWGFIFDNTVDEIKTALNQLEWQTYNDSSYINNPQLYDRQNVNPSWRINPYVIDNVLPRFMTIEKALYLEPMAENQSHLFCSIQGDTTKEIVYQMNPSIKYIDEEEKIKLEQIQEEKRQALDLEQKYDENEVESVTEGDEI